MELYQVNFYKIFPDCTTREDDIKIAFVYASSFDEASEKVKQRFKKEFEHARVFAVSVVDADLII